MNYSLENSRSQELKKIRNGSSFSIYKQGWPIWLWPCLLCHFWPRDNGGSDAIPSLSPPQEYQSDQRSWPLETLTNNSRSEIEGCHGNRRGRLISPWGWLWTRPDTPPLPWSCAWLIRVEIYASYAGDCEMTVVTPASVTCKWSGNKLFRSQTT